MLAGMASCIEAPAMRLADRTVPVTVRINRRARRLILKVDTYAPRILLTCPHRDLVAEGLDFIERRRDWIMRRLAEAPAATPFAPGATIPIRGVDHDIVHCPGTRRAVVQDAGRLLVGGEAGHVSRRVEDWLRTEARREFADYADTLCERIGVVRRRITVRDTRSRWGSCSSAGAISLSWRLILAPSVVYRYVVAHEVAHLRHMDHSPAFWAVVDSLVPDRREAEAWLKRHGNTLHGYGMATADAAPRRETIERAAA